jgi:hypothetical protein
MGAAAATLCVITAGLGIGGVSEGRENLVKNIKARRKPPPAEGAAAPDSEAAETGGTNGECTGFHGWSLC